LKKRLLRLIVNSWWVIKSIVLRDRGVIDSVRLRRSRKSEVRLRLW